MIKGVKRKDLKCGFEQKDGVSTAQSARKSSINLLGMNRKKEQGLNNKGGCGKVKNILTTEPMLKNENEQMRNLISKEPKGEIVSYKLDMQGRI